MPCPGIAIVGAGQWGINLVRVFESIAEVKAVVERCPERCALIRSRYPEIPVTDDYLGILRDPGIDAAVIATPANTHADLAMQALEHDKHVFVEKPFCLSVDDGERLHRCLKVRDRVVMVGHLLQYHGAVEKLRELVSTGVLGRVLTISSTRLNFGRLREDENVLWSFAPHDVSLILSLFPGLPHTLSVQGGAYINLEIADTTVMAMSFGDGGTAHLHVSWLYPYKERRMVVIGDRATAVFDDTRPWKEKLCIFEHGIGVAGWQSSPKQASPRYIDVDDREPLMKEGSHFIECIQKNLKPLTGIDEAMRVVRVLAAGQASLESGAASALDADR